MAEYVGSAASRLRAVPDNLPSMLELRPLCEHCATALPPSSTDARICSFECTFCARCVGELLANVCPNCGGGFSPRPIRPATTGATAIGSGPTRQAPSRDTARSISHNTPSSSPACATSIPPAADGCSAYGFWAVVANKYRSASSSNPGCCRTASRKRAKPAWYSLGESKLSCDV